MKKSISQTESVSLHIRRGDYVKLDHIYGGICTKEYYLEAIRYMENSLERPIFYVFSDDMTWAKSFLQYKENVVYVECNREDAGEYDLELMSLCGHSILANSSFSWWGAWLNENPNQIVIAPSKWKNNAKTPNVWCENWIKI